MRLLLVTQDFPPETGGIQSYMGHLARALTPFCESLVVVAPECRRATREFDDALPHPMERIGIHSSWLAVPLLWQLPALVRKHHATHVLYAQWFPAVAGLRLPTSIRQASIVHGRELLNHPLGALGLAMASPVLRRLDAVIPNSLHTASLLPAGIAPERIHVVHPGVDLDAFHPPTDEERRDLRERLGIPANTPVVTCLTRFVPRKGIDTLVRTAAILRQRIPGIRVVVGGSGPDRERIASMIHSLGLSETVLLPGRLPQADLPAFLSLGAFALLSREERRDVEGFGMVLAEAQACGAPVVAARSGGMPEAVGPGAGLIVPPDAPGETASALEAILSDSVASAEYGAAGRRYAASLDWTSRARSIARIV